MERLRLFLYLNASKSQNVTNKSCSLQVKVLYVRNLTVAVTEEKIQEVFEEYGKVERVKKIKDYAFVHFEDRDKATEAMRGLHRKDLMGAELDVSLAKPPSDKKKKEEMLRKREQRMMRAITTK